MFARFTYRALTTLLLLLVPLAGHARKPADHFKGKIILSQTPFPAGFKSDAAFIRHMKRVHTKRFSYGERERLPVEFMAFFARPYRATEFTARIFDVTDRHKIRAVHEFPIYPIQRETRILASGTELSRSVFEEGHRYHMVILLGAQGKALAEVKFSIAKAPPRSRRAGPAVVEFK